MQMLRLQDQVHAAPVDDDLVFLDIRADRYLCLLGQAAAYDVNTRLLRLSDPAEASDLMSAGLCAPSGGQALADQRPRPPTPTLTARRLTYPNPGLTDLADAGVAWLDLTAHYRGRRLPQILAAVRPSGVEPHPSGRLYELVDSFHRWIPYAPVSGKCLLRAFMLLRFLRRHGCDALWVFGVATWPFRAHCWLQVEDVVLDDDVERVRAYTPIFAQ